MRFNTRLYSWGVMVLMLLSLVALPASAEDEELISISEYIPIGKEPFKVNLAGKGDHVMVLRAQAYVITQRAKDQLLIHMPKIQNDVLELLIKQKFKNMRKLKHKKKLKKKILKLIHKVMEVREVDGGEEVVEVIFTQVLLQ